MDDAEGEGMTMDTLVEDDMMQLAIFLKMI